MSKISDLQYLGYLPLRHDEDLKDLDIKNVVYGLRFLNQNEKNADVKTKDHGDVQFAHFWPKEVGKRYLGSWSFATPALSKNQGLGAIPIKNKDLDEDEKYQIQQVTPATTRFIPDGTPGIVLAASMEKEEQKIFFPANSDLVAHHLGPRPPDFSTLVYDINAAGELDQDENAGLHTAWWVKELSAKFGSERALALNLTKSKGDKTGYGLFVGSGDSWNISLDNGGTIAKGKQGDVMAFASVTQSGFAHPGHVEADKHQFGKNSKGEALNSGHIATTSFFYLDQVRDAPLHFELDNFPRVQDFGTFYNKVHLRYNPNAVHPWVGGGDVFGRWEWIVKIPFVIPKPPIEPIPGEPPPPWWPDPNKGGGGGPGGGPPPGGGPGGGPPPGGGPSGGPGGGPGGKRAPQPQPKGTGRIPIDPVPGPDIFAGPKDLTAGDLNKLRGPVLDGLLGTGKGFPGEYKGNSKDISQFDLNKIKVAQEKPYSNLTTNMKMQLPGISFQAHPARTPEKFAKYNPELVDPKVIRDFLDNWPNVIQIEGYGTEEVPGKFTKNAGKPDRYLNGTGSGGILISPPEVGMSDLGESFAPAGVTQSDSYVTFLGNGKTHLAFGTPDVTLGRPVSGFKFAQESTTDLTLRAIDSSGNGIQTSTFSIWHHLIVNGSTAPNMLLWNTSSGANTNSGYLRFIARDGTATLTDMRLRNEAIDGVGNLAWYDGTTRLGYITQAGTMKIGGTGDLDLTGGSSGKGAMKAFEMATSAGASKVLTSDAGGVGTWQSLPASGDVTAASNIADNRLVKGDGGLKGIQESGILIPDVAAGVATIDGDANNLNLTANATGEVTVNDASEDVNFRVEGDNDANLLFTDAGLDKVGVGTNAPTGRFQVVGRADEIQTLVKANATQTSNIFEVQTSAGAKKFAVDGSGLQWGQSIAGIVDGRLTVTSGVPVGISNYAGSSTIYFTPFIGNRIALYDTTNSIWREYIFSEISIATSSVAAADFLYDVFIYDNSGTLTLELIVWSNSSTRATSLATQDSVYVKSGSANKRYLGTAYITSAYAGKHIDDKEDYRGIWNYYNKRGRRLYKQSDSSHTYASSAIRWWNNDSTLHVDFIIGVVEDLVELDFTTAINTVALSGIGYSTSSSWYQYSQNNETGTGRYGFGIKFSPNLGYGYFAILEAVPSGTGNYEHASIHAKFMG